MARPWLAGRWLEEAAPRLSIHATDSPKTETDQADCRGQSSWTKQPRSMGKRGDLRCFDTIAENRGGTGQQDSVRPHCSVSRQGRLQRAGKATGRWAAGITDPQNSRQKFCFAHTLSPTAAFAERMPFSLAIGHIGVTTFCRGWAVRGGVRPGTSGLAHGKIVSFDSKGFSLSKG